MAVELGPEHALIRALRNTRSETELTRALAAVLDAEPEMAAEFVRLVVGKAPHGDRVDLGVLPARLRCSAEDKVAEGRADLTFADEGRRWHVIFELKIYAGYGARPDRAATCARPARAPTASCWQRSHAMCLPTGTMKPTTTAGPGPRSGRSCCPS